MFGWGELSILIVSSFILLIFGEILPKYFARESADRFILLSAIPLRFFFYLFLPLVKFASSVSEKLTESTRLEADAVANLFTRDDIKGLVKESSEAGQVDKKESDIIEKVFELGEQRVYEAMTPRTDIVGIEINRSIKDAIKVDRKSVV